MSARRSIISRLPHALAAVDQWRERMRGRTAAVFLDHDGVLTPIVDDPTAATLSADTRAAVERAAARRPLAMISSRDPDDVRAMVAVPGLAYAGSHGFDMLLSDGGRERKGDEFLDALDAVERGLWDRLDGIAGVTAERKRYAIAVHTRRAHDEQTRERVAAAVTAPADGHDRPRVTGGKEIEQFRPDVDRDKGRTPVRLMDVLDLDAGRRGAAAGPSGPDRRAAGPERQPRHGA